MEASDSKQRPAHRQPTVDRCICHGVTFDTILKWTQSRKSVTLDDIKDHFGCGGSCGMCRPYLAITLKTGETRLPLMIPKDS
ncbi:MAG: (2Fe-2S)-binding protein [Phycisphaerales bacterium]|nr:(2Fe-2S)-binding protein [Phycisphaerales bacterium]